MISFMRDPNLPADIYPATELDARYLAIFELVAREFFNLWAVKWPAGYFKMEIIHPLTYVILDLRREGTLDCKIHWNPKFYPHFHFRGLKELNKIFNR